MRNLGVVEKAVGGPSRLTAEVALFSRRGTHAGGRIGFAQGAPTPAGDIIASPGTTTSPVVNCLRCMC